MFNIKNQTAGKSIINIGESIKVETQTPNEDEKYEVRLLPIYSCMDCDHIGYDIGTNKYNTYCTRLAGCTPTIKYGTEKTPEHFKFPKFCTLAKKV